MLEQFNCAPQAARLTKGACARMYATTLVTKPEVHEARYRCMGCPIGAAHSGHAVAGDTPSARAWRTICARCLQPTVRLISKRHCISCFNRQAEVFRGKNRKGGRPTLTDRLYTVRAAMLDGDTQRQIELHHATSPVELLVVMARKAEAPLAFGRLGHTPDV